MAQGQKALADFATKIADAVDRQNAQIAGLLAVIASLPETAQINEQAARDLANKLTVPHLTMSPHQSLAQKTVTQLVQQAQEHAKASPRKE